MKAEIICVGTELTLGERLNTNSAWLAADLARVGIETVLHATVADDEDALIAVLKDAADSVDIVILTGGIGPTPDDITRQAVARAAGVPLVRDAASLEYIESLFRSWGRQMKPSNAVQADFPEGSVIIPNPTGTAPGFAVTIGRCTFYILPGVPSEMKRMWNDSVLPRIETLSGSVLITRTINCFGRGESDITEAIKDLMAPGRNPSVGDTAEDTIIKIRIRASAPSVDKALAMVDITKSDIRSRIGDVIFGEDDDTLESVVVALLAARGLTVAAAESCTGGLVSTRLTDVPGASAVFTQSVVSYSNESKIRLLHVSPELLAAHGAVSVPVARAMAEGVRALSGADFGVSTTGIAGPSGATPDKPVGLVYIAVASAAGTDTIELRLRGDRAQVRDRATKQLLNMLRHKILAS